MTAPARPRTRPSLSELVPDDIATTLEGELYLARAVAEEDIVLDASALKDLVVNLLASLEERLRINTGIISENAALKRQVAERAEAVS